MGALERFLSFFNAEIVKEAATVFAVFISLLSLWIGHRTKVEVKKAQFTDEKYKLGLIVAEIDGRVDLIKLRIDCQIEEVRRFATESGLEHHPATRGQLKELEETKTTILVYDKKENLWSKDIQECRYSRRNLRVIRDLKHTAELMAMQVKRESWDFVLKNFEERYAEWRADTKRKLELKQPIKT